MPSEVILILLFLGGMILPILFMRLIIKGTSGGFLPEYEAQPIGIGAVSKLSIVRLGNTSTNMYKLCPDEQYLHFVPGFIGKMLGMKQHSVPWSDIEVLKSDRFGTNAIVGGRAFYGSKWVFEQHPDVKQSTE